MKISYRNDLPGRFNEIDILNRESDRYTIIKEGIVLPPYEVLIHAYSGCNLACDWCIGENVPIKLADNSEVIINSSKHGFDRLRDELKSVSNMKKLMLGILDYKKNAYLDGRNIEFKVENISFSGLTGEPLMAKDALLEAIKLGLYSNRRIGVFTNAIKIDADVIDVFVEMAYVNVSVDAGTKETYSRLKYRDKASGIKFFDQVIENIQKLTETTKKNKKNLEVNASYIVYSENFKELFISAKLLKENGVRYLRLKQDNSGKKTLLPNELVEAKSLITKIREELEDDSFTLIEVHPFESVANMERHFNKCNITDLMGAIGSDGHLYPCNYHPRPGGHTYGSAIENTFKEIWEGENRRTIRGKLPSICPPTCDPFKKRANEMLFNLNVIQSKKL
jgi:sulfatase maturation enzyme AslB (radical SAM superfamily)